MHVSIISPEHNGELKLQLFLRMVDLLKYMCGHDKYDEWDIFYCMALLNHGYINPAFWHHKNR